MSFEGYRAYPISLSGEVEVRDKDGNVDKTRTYLANNYMEGGWTRKAHEASKLTKPITAMAQTLIERKLGIKKRGLRKGVKAAQHKLGG